MKLIAVAAVVALMFSVAGCTGDDSAGGEAAPVSTTPTPALPPWPGAKLWTDASGTVQPWEEIFSGPGAEHCGWESATFLRLGENARGNQYLRDPAGVVRGSKGKLATTYAADVRLPAAAQDSGYRLGGGALWFAPNAAYFVTANATERWPRTLDNISCR